MIWVLVDVAVALLALLLLGLVGWSLYRRVRALMRTVSATSTTLSDASSGLAVTPRR